MVKKAKGRNILESVINLPVFNRSIFLGQVGAEVKLEKIRAQNGDEKAEGAKKLGQEGKEKARTSGMCCGMQGKIFVVKMGRDLKTLTLHRQKSAEKMAKSGIDFGAKDL